MRVLQVGLGGWGRSWAELVATTPGVQLAGCVDASEAALAWAQETLQVAADALALELDAALATIPCDAVLLVTPPATHRALAEAALAAGRHVLCEKPLATSLDDARAMAEAAERAGRVLMVSQNYRFRPMPRAVRRLIDAGSIGPLLHIAIRCLRDARTLLAPGDFRFGMPHVYARDMAIHHFDLLRAVTGQEVASLYAHSWRAFDSPFAYDASLACLLKLQGGASVSYTGDFAARGAETSWNGDWELVGEAGRIVWSGEATDWLTGTVAVQRWGEALMPVALPSLAVTDRRAVLLALAEALQTGQPVETDARDNIRSLALVEACVASIEGGQVITLAT
jgi:predicted dehydrogenase